MLLRSERVLVLMAVPGYRLGKHPKKVDRRTLKMRIYLSAALPPAPAAVTHERKVTEWRVYGNHEYPDCTVAAVGHMVEDWTANTRSAPVIIPDSEILAAYNLLSGGRGGDLHMISVLKHWGKTGIGGHRIDAFAEIRTGDSTETRQAVHIFGAAYVGLKLPDFVTKSPHATPDIVPWAVPASGVKANPGNPHCGHAVAIVGYDPERFWVVTWGKLKSMTPDFYAAYSDEAYAVLSPDWLMPGGKAPPGFNLEQLKADVARIRRERATPKFTG